MTAELLAPLSVAPTRVLRFTFDLEAGALRRDRTDLLAGQMVSAGLDVAWVDERSGWFGRRRRFTVTGPESLVRELISDIGAELGWQPGAVALPGY